MLICRIHKQLCTWLSMSEKKSMDKSVEKGITVNFAVDWLRTWILSIRIRNFRVIQLKIRDMWLWRPFRFLEILTTNWFKSILVTFGYRRGQFKIAIDPVVVCSIFVFSPISFVVFDQSSIIVDLRKNNINTAFWFVSHPEFVSRTSYSYKLKNFLRLFFWF